MPKIQDWLHRKIAEAKTEIVRIEGEDPDNFDDETNDQAALDHACFTTQQSLCKELLRFLKESTPEKD